ncbi:MAG: hypothetical protein WCW78_02025 [Candidatus Paceibacterota bacterium]|jgi:hypothetical protein
MRIHTIKKEYRILALAIVMFGAGALFFFYDKAQMVKVAEVHRTGQEDSNQTIEQPILKNMPLPSTFKLFSYVPNGDIPEVSDVCHDAYIAVLLFKANLDYRKDAARASFNRAFACVAGQSFHFAFSENDKKDFLAGEYYSIVADEGREGAWYNPR